MHLLCGGVIDGPTSVVSHSLSTDCLNPQPAGKLAAQLLADLLSSSSISSATAIRQVSYPSVPDLRKVLLSSIPSCVLEGRTPTSVAATNKSSQFTAFTSDIANQILFEAEEYVKNDDDGNNHNNSTTKICSSAAFIFHRFGFTDSSSSSSSSSPSSSTLMVGGGGGTSAQNISSVSLWLMVHLPPEVGATGNATRRILDLTNAASILSRWAEMCFMEDNFKSSVISSVAAANSTNVINNSSTSQQQQKNSSASENSGGNNDSQRNASSLLLANVSLVKFSEGALAVAVCSLDEVAGEFNDARHASVELKFAKEN